MGGPTSEITALLRSWRAGDRDALDRLFPLVYDELRALAQGHLRKERRGHTLQPTALVHEAYLRLVPRRDAALADRSQFLALAAQAIRRVLVDHARARLRDKRGGGRMQVTLDDGVASEPGPDLDILALEEALERLGSEEPINQRVVELRFFGGLTDGEAAEVLGVSERTVRRRWSYARTWLFRELSDESPDGGIA